MLPAPYKSQMVVRTSIDDGHIYLLAQNVTGVETFYAFPPEPYSKVSASRMRAYRITYSRLNGTAEQPLLPVIEQVYDGPPKRLSDYENDYPKDLDPDFLRRTGLPGIRGVEHAPDIDKLDFVRGDTITKNRWDSTEAQRLRAMSCMGSDQSEEGFHVYFRGQIDSEHWYLRSRWGSKDKVRICAPSSGFRREMQIVLGDRNDNYSTELFWDYRRNRVLWLHNPPNSWNSKRVSRLS